MFEGKKARLLVAALALLVPAAAFMACDPQSIIDKAQANKVLVATVMATPEYDVEAALKAQFAGDGGLPAFDGSTGDASIPDGSLALDGGFTLGGDGGLPTKVPAQTIAQVFFGERNQTDPKAKPTGITGATVTVDFSGKTFTLKDQGGGSYALTTQDDATLLYVPNTKYTITVQKGADTYSGTVDGPAEEKIQEFHAGKPVIEGVTAKTQDVKLTRSATENIAFTTVVPVKQGGSNDPTYTDFPNDPWDLLDLVANDSKWKQKVITIPAASDSAAKFSFPESSTYYLVSVNAVKRGETSNNLFIGSVLFAGTSDLGMIKTK